MEIVFFAELNATLKEAEGSTSQPTNQPASHSRSSRGRDNWNDEQ